MSEHYKKMEIEPYEVMRSMGILKEYLRGNAIKYLMRAGHKKGNAEFVDLHKAADSLATLMIEVSKESEAAF